MCLRGVVLIKHVDNSAISMEQLLDFTCLRISCAEYVYLLVYVARYYLRVIHA